MRKIQKIILCSVAVLIPSILLFAYFCVCGGPSDFNDFDSVKKDYDIIAKVALDYGKSIDHNGEHILINFMFDGMEHNGSAINLNDREKQALDTVVNKFGYAWVSDESVIFWIDELHEYGLVYSKKPLTVIRKMKDDWYTDGEYSRLTSEWYEIKLKYRR